MLEAILWIAAAAVTLLALLTLGTMFAFSRYVRGYRRPEVPLDRLPRVALLMGMKGADPYLRQSLLRLFSQDYPDYSVHIAIESRHDPAWQVVQDAITESRFANVEVVEYDTKGGHGPVSCTNSKIVQLVRGLDESIEIIAMADADVLADSRWLLDLVAPLVVDEKIGATYGARWFLPSARNPGSLARHPYAAFSAPMMHALGIGWGGVMALRMSDVRRAGLVDKWARVIALDASIQQDMRRLGKRMFFVPSLFSVNTEACRLGFCVNFFERQFRWTRLYHEHWRTLVWQGVIGSLPIIFAAIATVPLMVSGEGEGSRVIIVAAAGYWIAAFAAVLLLQRVITRVARERGTVLTHSPLFNLGIFLVLPLTQIVWSYAMIRALLLKEVAWRGRVLTIEGPYAISERAAPTPDRRAKNESM